jgi:CubicO group peptidase (beta-lactamase class C family)
VRLTLILCSFIFLIGCQSSTGNNTPSLVSATASYNPKFPQLSGAEIKRIKDSITQFFASNHFLNHLNGGILIAKNGTIVFEQYQGYSNPATRDSIDAETPIQIASTSKTFTGIGVLKLIQQGKLGLNDSLQKFFPGFPYPGITVKMLLNHRSGLPEYLYYFEKNNWDRKLYATNNDVLNTLMTWQPPKASNPDRRFDYCNTNFVLLALIIEKMSGMTYPQFMKQNFFDPLQMNHTFVYTPLDTATAVQSYDWRGGLWQRDFSDGPYGDKNIYSTPRDLLKWDQALYTGNIVDQKLLDSAYTPYSNERKSQHNYGLGWRLLVFENGKKVPYHNGRWHGFNSAFSRLTDEKVTIIMLTNKFNRGVYSTARKMYNLFGEYDGQHDDSAD